MARMSVSLPDELNVELEDQVAKSGQGVSEIVQAALRAYFKPAAPTPAQPASEPPPAPLPPSPPPTAPPQASLPAEFLNGFSELQDYLAACSLQQEQLRRIKRLRPFGPLLHLGDKCRLLSNAPRVTADTS